MFFKTARAEVRRKEWQSNEKFRPKASEGVFTHSSAARAGTRRCFLNGRSRSPTKRTAVQRKVPAEGHRRGLHAFLCSPGWSQEMFLLNGPSRSPTKRTAVQRAKRATALDKRKSIEHNCSPSKITAAQTKRKDTASEANNRARETEVHRK